MAMSMQLGNLIRCSSASVVLLATGPAIAASAPEEAAPAIDHQDAAALLDALVVVRVEMEGGDGLAEVLRGEIVTALSNAHVDPDLPGQAPLEVVVSPDPESLGAYEVAYRHRGVVRESWSCACTGDELRNRLTRGAIDVWNGIVTPTSQDPSVPASPVPAEPEHLDTEHTPSRRGRGQGLWITGVATTAVGTTIVVGTTALLFSDVAVARDHNPTTLGLLGGGLVMVAAGATLWSVGARRRNSARVSVFPTMRSRGFLVSIRGHF